MAGRGAGKDKQPEAEREAQVYGYVRVSTDRQDGDRQVGEIIEYCKSRGLGDAKIVKEIMSGVKDKPELERIITGLGKGDTLAVWELSRLTRSGMRALSEVAERVRKAGAVLVETRTGTTIGNDIAGDAYIFALGLSARIEREMISARVTSANRARKEKGLRVGRIGGKSKLDSRKVEIEGYQKMKLSKSKIAELLGCSRSCYLTWLEKEKGSK